MGREIRSRANLPGRASGWELSRTGRGRKSVVDVGFVVNNVLHLPWGQPVGLCGLSVAEPGGVRLRPGWQQEESSS